jgi:hypothetical protein
MKSFAAKTATAALLITATAALSGCAVYEQPYYPSPAYYSYGPPPPVVYYGYSPYYWGGGHGGWGHGGWGHGRH